MQGNGRLSAVAFLKIQNYMRRINMTPQEEFIEIYNKFEEEKQPQLESLKEIFYWYASDYCDVFAADGIKDRPCKFKISLCL